MALNRNLIDSIKKTCARRASAELEEIVRANDLDRWSEEAFVAAREVLADRASGLARAPLVPEKDSPPPSTDVHWGALFDALTFAAGGLVGGGFNLSETWSADQPVDRPVPFGPNTAWLAVETTDTAAVGRSLGCWKLREVTWGEGIASAARSGVFITPPLGDWTLAVGASLFPTEELGAFVKPLLERLSRSFPEAQYFCTHRSVGLHAWARAESGRLLRGYGWLGQPPQALWNEGPQTEEERDLGFRFGDAPAETENGDHLTTPDEGCVLQLASLWSVDPSALDEHFSEPVFGLIGNVPQRWRTT